MEMECNTQRMKTVTKVTMPRRSYCNKGTARWQQTVGLSVPSVTMKGVNNQWITKSSRVAYAANSLLYTIYTQTHIYNIYYTIQKVSINIVETIIAFLYVFPLSWE